MYGEGSGEEKQALKADYLQKNRKMEEWLDDFAGIGGISTESGKILSAAEEEAYARQRNCNYKYLLPKLDGKMKFTPVLSEITEDAVPLYLPVYAKNQEEMQKYLGQHGIYAPVLWPIGKENENCLTKEEKYIFEHLLALPIDQRYGIEEMEYIAETLEEYEGAALEKRAQSAEQVLNPHKPHSIQHATSEIIGIRVDANDIVATGHVMRCVTIAKQLLKKGKRILFLTADEYPMSISYLQALLELPEVKHVCLHTLWNRMEEEVPKLKEELKKAGCSKLLVDSYQVTEAYFEQLKDACKIVYIDDCFEGIYSVDMVINYNAYHVRFPYKEAYQKKSVKSEETKVRAKLLLGTAYVPLREEFRKESFDVLGGEEYQKCVTGSVGEPHVLLSSGGGDIYNALGGILQGIAADHQWDDVIFHVVVGGFNRNGEELKKLAAEHENIKLHHNVTNMAELMNQCHAAVSAAGTMLFELSAMQVPTVFFVSADNQQYDSEFFAAEERMLFAGDIRADREECLNQIENQLFGLLKDRDMQAEMKKKLHEVVDGNGAARIAEAIVAL